MAEPLFETGNPQGGGGDLSRPMIRQSPGPSLGVPIGDDSTVNQAPEPAPTPTGSSKIRTFEQRLGAKHADSWSRTPNTTGTGAIHVKSFHCKLTGDSLAFLDQQINEWLDANPEYEVKFVTTSVGIWTGKLKEPNLIVNVWV
ncbi:MAG: hypothetical protein Kow0022_13230 [Phycisphaerales bacterium]